MNHEKLSESLNELSQFTLDDISELIQWCKDLHEYLGPHDPTDPFDLGMLKACLRNKYTELTEIDHDALEGTKYTREYIFNWRVGSIRKEIERVMKL